jgi:acyl dehydratase
MSRHVVVQESEYDIGAVRSDWIGRSLGRSIGRYPVEYDPIRRYCHMAGDTNPLYLDPVIGGASPYGGTPAPHGLLHYFASTGAWPRLDYEEAGPTPKAVPKLGDRGINMNVRWDYFAPALVGHSLEMEWTVADVFVKSTRLDPKSVWMVTVGEISNTDGLLVARCTNTVLYHRPAHDVKKEASSTRSSPRLTERGHALNGESIGALEMKLTPTQMVLQVSGSQDWNRVHHDPEFARSSGHASIFCNTGWTQGLMCRLVTDHIGDQPWWLASLDFRMTGMNVPDDDVMVFGAITDRHVDSEGIEVQTIAVEVANGRVGTTTTGTAVVRCAFPQGLEL